MNKLKLAFSIVLAAIFWSLMLIVFCVAFYCLPLRALMAITFLYFFITIQSSAYESRRTYKLLGELIGVLAEKENKK